MKKILLIFLLSGFCYSLFANSSVAVDSSVVATSDTTVVAVAALPSSGIYIEYIYDDSGNRTTRTYYGKVTMRSAKMSTSNNDAENEEETPEVIETLLVKDFSVKIYPNPTQGQLILECFGVSNVETGNYALYDLYGKLLKKAVLSTVQTIDMQNLPAGSYVLSLELEKTYRWKVIKQ